MQPLTEAQLKYIFQQNNLEFIRKIGNGGFGTVYLANSANKEFQPYAVKCVSTKKTSKKASHQKYILSEINSMDSIKHPNIIKLYRTFTSSDCIFLVMEYCQLGNLYTYQYSHPDKMIKFDEALIIFYEIVRGVQSIHKMNIIHRDIKCENILLKKISKSKNFVCKIGDFGFSKLIDDHTVKSQCGTPNFMAPEIISGKTYDKSIDIWSLGVVLYYILFGEYPFKGLNPLYDIQLKCQGGYNLIQELKKNPPKKRNKSVNSSDQSKLSDLFAKIFILEPQKRITITGILNHPLIKQLQIQDKESSSTEQIQSVEDTGTFQIKKEEFLATTLKEIKNLQLFCPQDFKVIEFYFYRARAHILKLALKEIVLEDDNKYVQLKIKKQITDLIDRMEALAKEISTQAVAKIQYKSNKVTYFNNETFQTFKEEYRFVLSQIFVGINAKVSNEQLRQRMKLKVLCCHTINRVFEKSIGEYFTHYLKWLKMKSFPLYSTIQFTHFNLWLQSQSAQNCIKTINMINSHFYGKKN